MLRLVPCRSHAAAVFFVVGVAVPVLVSGQSAPGADSGKFILFSPAGATNITVAGINDSSTVGGSLNGPDGPQGFVRTFSGAYHYFSIPGASGLTVTAINRFDKVTGHYSDSTGVVHGFIRPFGQPAISFDAPGAGTGSGQGTFPTAMNIAGTVVGYFTDASDENHGFLRSSTGAITVVDAFSCPSGPLASQGTVLTGINSSGTASGEFVCESEFSFGFSRSADGTLTDFYAPPNDIFPIYTSGINDLGQVTGYYTGYGCEMSVACVYVWQPGDGSSVSPLSTGFSSLGTYPTAINNAGSITGYYMPSLIPASTAPSGSTDPGFVGVVSGSGYTFTTFEVPNTSGAVPTGLNSEGVVAGYNVEGFLLTP